MYLVLQTYTHGGLHYLATTQCAIVEISPEYLDYWEGMMDQASQLSAALDQWITLVFDDYGPVCYQEVPDTAGGSFRFVPNEAGIQCLELDPSWALLERDPFLHREAPQPVDQSYCVLQVAGDELHWCYRTRQGSIEEYTEALTRADLAEIRANLHTPERSPR